MIQQPVVVDMVVSDLRYSFLQFMIQLPAVGDMFLARLETATSNLAVMQLPVVVDKVVSDLRYSFLQFMIQLPVVVIC